MSANDKKQPKQPDNARQRQRINDDVWDPTGYFRNKDKREDEALKGCLWIVVAMVITALVATLAKCTGATWPT